MLRRSAFCVVLVFAAVVGFIRGQDGDIVRASQLLKMEVRNASNDVVGEVRDFVLDRQTGGFAYAVVAFNRLPGKAGKLFAVPWQALTPSWNRKSLMLSMTNDAIAKAPAFDPNKWPDMEDARYAAKVGVAYGVRRPELTASTDEPRVIGTRETTPLGTSRSARSATILTGTVVDVYPGDLTEVVIATEQGDISVMLSPISFLNDERLTFDDNANVRVRGYFAIDGERSVFVAVEAMTHPGRWVRLRNDDLTPVWGDTIDDDVRYLTGTVELAGNGYATVLTDDEGLRVVSIAPANYFESRHWRLRPNRAIGVWGYDDPDTKRFIAISVDHEGEHWRLRLDDGTPYWQ